MIAQQINSNYILRFTIRRELSTVGTEVFKYITVRLRNPLLYIRYVLYMLYIAYFLYTLYTVYNIM